MGAQVTIPIGDLITIMGSILTPLIVALVFLYKKGEAKSKTIIELTRGFVQCTENNTIALRENTKMIERLPELFILHLKANGK